MKNFFSAVLLTALTSLQLAITPAQAGEQVYKFRIRDAATGSLNQDDLFSKADKDREEWVVVTVIDQRRVRVRHTTNIEDKILPIRRWFDHPAIAIRICNVDDFDSRNCQTTQGDTATLPQGKSIHDIAIDFKYSEGGNLYTRSVQIPSR